MVAGGALLAAISSDVATANRASRSPEPVRAAAPLHLSNRSTRALTRRERARSVRRTPERRLPARAPVRALVQLGNRPARLPRAGANAEPAGRDSEMPNTN
jgi:hypothetical protein